MDSTTLQSKPPDSSPAQQDQPANRTGSVLAFPPQSESSERRLLRSFITGKQANQKSKRKAKDLLSKYTKCYWPISVGARVAGVSNGRIVQGVILGTKARPWRAAAFRRKGFAGCWILLDSVKRVVGNELRPIQEVNAANGQDNV